MTLEKAIEIITHLRRDYLYTFNQDPIDALGLGIESLQAWKQFREGRWLSSQYNLPGETKE